jgi:membrane protein YdbS with pleckstrin-like domain
MPEKRTRHLKKDGPGWRQVLFTPLSSLLEEDESVLYETRRHPVAILPFAVAAFILAIPTYGISLILLVPPLIQMKTNNYAVTNKRVLARQGVLKPRFVQIPVEEIFEASVGAGLFGERLGMGRVVLKKGRETFRFKEIKDPQAFMTSMMEVRRATS